MSDLGRCPDLRNPDLGGSTALSSRKQQKICIHVVDNMIFCINALDYPILTVGTAFLGYLEIFVLFVHYIFI